MDKWVGKVAVVTGASAGIGMAITIKLAKEGMRVAALARRDDRLQELAERKEVKGMIRGYRCDICDREAVSRVFSQIEKEMGPIRVLVNNAGILARASLIDIDIDCWKRVFDTNVFGMFSCIKQLITSYKKRSSSDLVQIINVNSMAGQYVLPDPLVIVYSSSKHCVTLLSRALIKQLAQENLNIRVASLSPGVVKTELRVAAEIDADYSGSPYLEADNIADAAVSVLSAPPNVIISELTIKSKGETL